MVFFLMHAAKPETFKGHPRTEGSEGHRILEFILPQQQAGYQRNVRPARL